jgi:hypothetical protein
LGPVHDVNIRLDFDAITAIEGIQPRLERMAGGSIGNVRLTESTPNNHEQQNEQSAKHFGDHVNSRSSSLIELLDNTFHYPGAIKIPEMQSVSAINKFDEPPFRGESAFFVTVGHW